MMKSIVLVAEDILSRAVIRQIIDEFSLPLMIGSEEPIRGAEIRQKIYNYNRLASKENVVVLVDMDEYDYPAHLAQSWFGGSGEALSPEMQFLVAFNEVELWLLSDTEAFSKYLGVSIDVIPPCQTISGRTPDRVEIKLPYKASLFIMKDMLSVSSKESLKTKLIPVRGAKKGPAYNTALLPFVTDKWQIRNAMKRSYSLTRAVRKLKNLSDI